MPTARPTCSWTSAKARRSWLQHLGNAVRLRGPQRFRAGARCAEGQDGGRPIPRPRASAIFDRLDKAGAKIARLPDPCQLPKACKNPVEMEGMRKAHIRDGAALSKFLCWFAREAPDGQLTEIDAAEELEGFRKATGALSDLSFDSISGGGANRRA